MTTPHKLPPDSFALYVALGPERSYQLIADHYQVSKRAVTARAADEDWQGRLVEIEKVALASAESTAADALTLTKTEHLRRQAALHQAIREVATPQRVKAVLAGLIKAAIQKEDVGAARLLLERLLGKPRNEPLAGMSLDLPEGLETASDVRRAANALLQAVAQGGIAPEDGQKAAAIVEAARRSVETEELEARIAELESRQKEGRR